MEQDCHEKQEDPMRKLIKSSLFVNEIQGVLEQEFFNDIGEFASERGLKKEVVYEIHVVYSKYANPTCSIIKETK